MNGRSLRPLRILYAEDNFDDVELLRAALEHSPIEISLDHVENGVTCMEYLRKAASLPNAPMPDVLLLDLNMPVMDGFEVLQAIISDSSLCWLPVVVLTTSSAPEDVERMYRMRCSSYVRKPLELPAFVRAVNTIVEYWFGVVTLPTR